MHESQRHLEAGRCLLGAFGAIIPLWDDLSYLRVLVLCICRGLSNGMAVTSASLFYLFYRFTGDISPGITDLNL